MCECHFVISWLANTTSRTDYAVAQSRVISSVLSCWSNLDFFQYPVPRGSLIKLIDPPSAHQWLVEEWSCDTVWPISRSLLWRRILGKVFFALHKSCLGESDPSFPVLRSHCLHVIILLRSWGRMKWRECISKMKMRSDERGRIQFLDDFIELLN